MNQRLSMPVTELVNSLAKHGQQVYFLRDFKQCWYQSGLLGLTLNVEDTAEFILGLLGSDVENARFCGTSSGGYAAILFGVMLQVKSVIAFAP